MFAFMISNYGKYSLLVTNFLSENSLAQLNTCIGRVGILFIILDLVKFHMLEILENTL